MKFFILVLFVVNLLNAQNEVPTSNIEERNVDGQSLVFFEGKVFDGIVYENFVSNKLKYSVKDGKKEGPYIEYFKNGELKRKTSFSSDKYDGPYQEYYENGNLYIKASFKNGRYGD